MPITRSKKEEIVKDLGEKLKKAQSVALLKFHGLSVAKISALRRLFRAEEADYTVAKKTLIKIAFKNAGKEVEGDLEGEVAVAAGYADPLSVFKIASDFMKKEKEGLSILGGIFEGVYVDADTARRLGKIPSREVLLAQLMGVIQGNTKKLVYLVDQLARKGQ